MFNKYDEKTRNLRNKYGYQAFVILMVEIVIITLFYISGTLSNSFYKYLFVTIDTGDLLLLPIWLPLGYLIIRSIISNCIDPKSRIIYLILAPLNTILHIRTPNSLAMEIPFIVVLWAAFIASVISLIYRKPYNKD